jgi:hypothetical protein
MVDMRYDAKIPYPRFIIHLYLKSVFTGKKLIELFVEINIFCYLPNRLLNGQIGRINTYRIVTNP